MTRVACIAINTFRESVRSKILYSLLFFAVILVLVATFFGSVTLGDQLKVIKDFGLFSSSFFAVTYAVISGAAFLHKELSRKTIYNILAKPVQRWEFICGKYFGMLITVALMLLLMGGGLLVFAFFFNFQFDFVLMQAFVQIFFQCLIVCALTIFFSAVVVTPMLSGAFTFGIFLAGRSSEYLLYFIKNEGVSGLTASILKCTYWLLPHLDSLDISNQVVYGRTISFAQTVWSCFYAVGYASVLLVLAALIFARKEFN